MDMAQTVDQVAVVVQQKDQQTQEVALHLQGKVMQAVVASMALEATTLQVVAVVLEELVVVQHPRQQVLAAQVHLLILLGA
jgi:hypothetical protein